MRNLSYAVEVFTRAKDLRVMTVSIVATCSHARPISKMRQADLRLSGDVFPNMVSVDALIAYLTVAADAAQSANGRLRPV